MDQTPPSTQEPISNPPIQEQPIEPVKTTSIFTKIILFLICFVICCLAIASIFYLFLLFRHPITKPPSHSTAMTTPATPTPQLDQMFTENIATMFAIGGYTKDASQTASMEYYNPQVNTWKQAPSMDIPRSNESATVYNNAIYVFGGDDQIYGQTLSSVEMFNPQTNMWEDKTPMPQGRAGAIAVTVGDRIYLIGGYSDDFTPTAKVAIYNPLRNSWSTGQSLPTLVDSTTAGESLYTCNAVGSLIYCPRLGNKGYTLVYDTSKNSWDSSPTENRSTIGTGRGMTFGSKIYMLSQALPQNNYLSYYDTATDSLASVTSYPRSLREFAVAQLGDFFVVLGGQGSAEPVHDVYAINTGSVKEQYSLAPLITPRAEFAAVTLPFVYGSDNTSSISGVILQEGKPVLHDVITISTPRVVTDQHGNQSEALGYTSTTTQTDEHGRYIFPYLGPNRYQVQVMNPQQPGSFVIPIYKGNQYVDLQANQQISDYNYSF